MKSIVLQEILNLFTLSKQSNCESISSLFNLLYPNERNVIMNCILRLLNLRVINGDYREIILLHGRQYSQIRKQVFHNPLIVSWDCLLILFSFALAILFVVSQLIYFRGDPSLFRVVKQYSVFPTSAIKWLIIEHNNINNSISIRWLKKKGYEYFVWDS